MSLGSGGKAGDVLDVRKVPPPLTRAPSARGERSLRLCRKGRGTCPHSVTHSANTTPG